MSTKWKRSKRGNLYKDYDDLRVTLFERRDGWRYCIAGAMGPTYSKQAWPTMRQAMKAVLAQLRKIKAIV